jgi:hypothetical protein
MIIHANVSGKLDKFFSIKYLKMKKVNHLVIILLIMGLQGNLIKAQNSSNSDDVTYRAKSDSMMKVFQKMIKEHELHKNNKDSAWINDFDGHYIWDSRSKSKEGKTLTILDSITNNFYVLDTSHTIITAFNKSKKIIWKTNPREDNSLPEYRHKNPTITYFKINTIGWNVAGKYKIGDRMISISYSNSQFGFLDLKTGKFFFAGQD